MEKEFYVLYGSQTGNAEHISREIHDKFVEMGLKSKYSSLNTVKKADLKEVAHAVVIVCSTTGNGDSPENSDAFWRWIKARANPKTLFEGLPFSVLGLGDTNYDKFCFMGKSIDKRFDELGGKRLVELHCADEPTNLEEVVEEWKAKVISAVKQLSDTLCGSEPSMCDAANGEECLNLESIKLSDESSTPTDLPEGIMSAADVWTALGLEGDQGTPPLAKLLPGGGAGAPDRVEILDAEGASNIGNVTDAAIAKSGNETNNSQIEWTVDKPFMSEVMRARYMTEGSAFEEGAGEQLPWGEEKKVIEMFLSLASSGIHYEPGDSVAICCPNPEAIVSLVLSRLNKCSAPPARPLTRETLVRKKNCDPCTIGELLSYKIDLVGFPKKAGVMKLSQCCSDPREASLLQHICSKGDVGKKLWRHFIELQCIGVGELLALFPSCTPSLDQLVSVCSTMPPRCYSIASSPLRDPNAVRIAFSAVKYTCSAGVGEGNPANTIQRRGLCTTYLEKCLEPWLRPAGLKSAGPESRVTVRLFHKPSISFKLPGSTSYPLILIGPGTGVAPFIGFLEQREALKKELLCIRADLDPAAAPAAPRTISGSNSNIKFGAKECCMGEWRGGIELEDLPIEGNTVDNYLSSVPPGPIWLFFGCRSTKDFLFQDEIQQFVHGTKTLDNLEIAFSRMGAEKVYVQDKMRNRGEELAKLILEQCAYIYICGDGNKMAKDVEAAIVDILVAHGSAKGITDEGAAKALLTQMRQRRRFVLDIWS